MSAVSAQEARVWMRDNGDVLRALLAEEGGDDPEPAGDAAIRAHLRFMIAALAATAPEPLADELGAFTHELPGWLAEAGEELLDQHLAIAEGAMALEEHLQFGVSPGTDPALDAGLERRARIGGWTRIVLLGLEGHLGPAWDGLEAQTLTRLGSQHRELGRLIVALDREARAAARRASGGAPDLDTEDMVGQVAALQAHVRITLEALAASLSDSGPQATA